MRDTKVRPYEKVPGENEQLRVNYGHKETMVGMGIVAVVCVGGIVCMVAGIPGGEQIVLAAVGVLGAYAIKGARTSRSRR